MSPRPYADPYLAGAALGLVLLGAFAIVGHGLGASGATAEVVAAAIGTVALGHAEANAYLRPYVAGGRDPLATWIVFEVLGIVVGAFLSARLAGRVRPGVERGPRQGARRRLAWALAGGLLMGFAARLARGCTSGQALSGGALLSVGSWIFLLALFAAGYAAAPLVRKSWT